MNLDHFLRKRPQPVAVLADGQRVEANGGGRQWRDLVKTIVALNPRKLSAIDAKGNILRTVDLGTDDLEDDDEDKETTPVVSGEAAQLALFARLLADAYKQGSGQAQPLVQTAMDMVGLLSTRLSKAESEIERLRAVNVTQALKIGELSMMPAEVDEGGGVVGALLQGVLQGQQQQARIKPPVRAVPNPGEKK